MAKYELEKLDVENIKAILLENKFTGRAQECANYAQTVQLLMQKLDNPIKEVKDDNSKKKA